MNTTKIKINETMTLTVDVKPTMSIEEWEGFIKQLLPFTKERIDEHVKIPKIKKRIHASKEEQAKKTKACIELAKQAYTNSEIAEKINLPRVWVSNHLQRWRKHHDLYLVGNRNDIRSQRESYLEKVARINALGGFKDDSKYY